MSVTHPETVAAPSLAPRDFIERHPQLAPFLVGVAIVAVSIAVSLSFTGLPA